MARKPQVFRMERKHQKLAEENLNLARREAWRMQRTTQLDYHTLESVAFEGLCKAAYRYDPERINPTTGRTMRFSSLAVPTIRGELLHYIRDRTYSMRLPHRMREQWVRGRKLLYRGSSDLEVAKELGISKEDWLETRKVCSGPPLELKEQAKPTEPLEASEMDFAQMYLDIASKAIETVAEEHESVLDNMEVYLSGTGSRVPIRSVDALLDASGCHVTDWSEVEIQLEDGIKDFGNGRVQTSLF